MAALATAGDGAAFVRALESYLGERLGASLRVRGVCALGKDGGEKRFGYGVPLRVDLAGASVPSVVVHTITRNRGGHDTLADRAAQALLAHETFNTLPRHVRSLDVGAVLDDGTRVSLARARDVFFVTEYAAGTPYFEDLDRIASTGEVTEDDRRRVDGLAALLATIHRERHVDRAAYVRRLRQLVGADECIAGLIDTYDAVDTSGFTSEAQLLSIEQSAVAWRHRLKAYSHRLARVHGDFHPWNMLFESGARTPILLDRSRGALGEPADDVAALVVNYLVRALDCDGGMTGPFGELWRRFFQRYLAASGDDEILRVLPPYLAWRALVLASPVWYPRFDPALRRRIFGFIEAVLGADRFAFESPEAWLSAPEP